MRNIIFSILMISACSLNAQTDGSRIASNEKQPAYFQYQVGMNATNFIKQFIVPNNMASTNLNPYDFTAKMLYHPNSDFSSSHNNMLYGLRFGFGYTDTRNAQFDVLANTESSSTTNVKNIRFGLEAQHILSDRWTFYYGLDYIWGYNSAITNSSFVSGGNNALFKTNTSDVTHTTGAGPVLGAQFKLNRHICLSTELSLYFTRFDGSSVTKTYNTFTQVSDVPSNINTNGRKSNIIAPTFIQFNFIF